MQVCSGGMHVSVCWGVDGCFGLWEMNSLLSLHEYSRGAYALSRRRVTF